MMTQKKDMICKNENAQKNAMSFGQQQHLFPMFSYILNESIFNISKVNSNYCPLFQIHMHTQDFPRFLHEFKKYKIASSEIRTHDLRFHCPMSYPLDKRDRH